MTEKELKELFQSEDEKKVIDNYYLSARRFKRQCSLETMSESEVREKVATKLAEYKKKEADKDAKTKVENNKKNKSENLKFISGMMKDCDITVEELQEYIEQEKEIKKQILIDEKEAEIERLRKEIEELKK